MLSRRRRTSQFAAAVIAGLLLLTTDVSSASRADVAFAPVRVESRRVGVINTSYLSPSPVVTPQHQHLLQYRSISSSPRPSPSSSSSLALTRYDNLVSGLAEISFAFTIGVLYSEAFVAVTGCGPPDLSDFLERICYQGVILSAGLSVFCRIVTRKSVASYLEEDYFGEGVLETSSVVQVRAAEVLGLLAVVGAVVALALQIAHGERMDGMSGIDRDLCGALRDL